MRALQGVTDLPRLLRWARCSFSYEQHTFCEMLVQEHVEGPKLGDVDTLGLPLRDRIRLGLELVDAVGRMHAAGYVHDDIKGDNVIVRRPGNTICLIDFGNAYRMDWRATGRLGPIDAALEDAECPPRSFTTRSDVVGVARCIDWHLVPGLCARLSITGAHRGRVEGECSLQDIRDCLARTAVETEGDQREEATPGRQKRIVSGVDGWECRRQ